MDAGWEDLVAFVGAGLDVDEDVDDVVELGLGDVFLGAFALDVHLLAQEVDHAAPAPLDVFVPDEDESADGHEGQDVLGLGDDLSRFGLVSRSVPRSLSSLR